MDAYSLLELNSMVRQSIEHTMNQEFWVEAELSECRENRGHCFMELIQKDEKTSTPIAKASAKCWANKWLTIRPYFERTTGQQLHAGMKVLLQVYPQFHEAYGFSWIGNDIDPTYTLGDMARKRQEIIQKLKAEGVFDLQKELQLPTFCQHIAVISSQTAAGYGDFYDQLTNNPYGFNFDVHLFPAIMQGEDVEQSIISALEQIYNMPFDCVVIIRGGGATSDMSGFDTLALAENVANFPIPIITGIGHERDENILDMIAHTRVKTPTAAAALLIDHLKGVLETIEGAQSAISHYAQQKLSALNFQLSTLSETIPRLFSIVRTQQEAKIDALYSRLPMLIERRLTSENHRLQLIDEKLKALDPTLLLARGYSNTLHNGKTIKDVSVLKPGDKLETHVAHGIIHSKVTTS